MNVTVIAARVCMAGLALRPAAMGLVRNKPAWKLFNAWLAGVPAVLGPESGYRELREGPLDYVEAATPDDALRALQRLHDEPAAYAAMVANGLRRGSAFTTQATLARWQQLLSTLDARLQRLQQRPPTRAARRRWEFAARLRRAWRSRCSLRLASKNCLLGQIFDAPPAAEIVARLKAEYEAARAALFAGETVPTSLRQAAE